MIMKKQLFMMSMFVALGMFCACSDDDDATEQNAIKGCFSACITGTQDNSETIKAIITNTPETLYDYDNQLHIGISVYLLKCDLPNIGFQKGDIVDFEIIHYETLPLPEDRPNYYTNDFFCRVKPCK